MTKKLPFPVGGKQWNWIRLQLFEQQKGHCAACGNRLALDRTSHIDHCHQSDKIRGLVCQRCNQLIGWFEALRPYNRLIAHYLDKPRTFKLSPLPAKPRRRAPVSYPL